MKAINGIDEYFHLMKTRPECFRESEIYPIEADRSVIEEYSRQNGVSLGVVYKSKYTILVVDLIKKHDGGYFTYERILPASEGKGVVCVPVFEDKLIMIRQYRHSMRAFQLCFPRGYGEDNLTAIENAKKELHEEIGACVKSAVKVGETVADSGLAGALVDIILCSVSEFEPQPGHEGICDTILVTKDELKQKIENGEINDGFTLAAFAFCRDKI